MRKMKRATLAALCGAMLFQFGGCLSFGGNTWWGRLFWDAAIFTGLEFATDNDGIFDLFEDGEPTATTE